MRDIRLLAFICSIITFLILFGAGVLILTLYQVEIEGPIILHMAPQTIRYGWRTRDPTATNIGFISIIIGVVAACGLIIYHMKETKN